MVPLEYESFLYTHTKEYIDNTDILQIFEKDPSTISPDEADIPGENLDNLSEFVGRVKRRHTIPPKFKDWRELQLKIDEWLQRLPSSVPARYYSKVSLHQFDFRVMGLGPFREGQLMAAWSDCPCSVYRAGGCDFETRLHYRPPQNLRNEMHRHLEELWANPKTNPRWKENQPSFKTVSIQEHEGKLWFRFCHSTWHQFLGTNQGTTKDKTIWHMLHAAPDAGDHLELSPFSNNLGFAIAVIDRSTEVLYFTIRLDVSVHPHLKSTAVGTQLLAYDPKHVDSDGVPDVFKAVRQELYNEAGISTNDIRDLYISSWGVGMRTGTPELLLLCDTGKSLAEVNKDVCMAKVKHASEFDRLYMKSLDGCNIVLDYQLLANLDRCHERWEPEAAVASCLALDTLAEGCISYETIQPNGTPS